MKEFSIKQYNFAEFLKGYGFVVSTDKDLIHGNLVTIITDQSANILMNVLHDIFLLYKYPIIKMIVNQLPNNEKYVYTITFWIDWMEP